MSIKYPKKVKVEVKPSRKKSQNILLQYMLGVVERSLKQTYSGEKNIWRTSSLVDVISPIGPCSDPRYELTMTGHCTPSDMTWWWGWFQDGVFLKIHKTLVWVYCHQEWIFDHAKAPLWKVIWTLCVCPVRICTHSSVCDQRWDQKRPTPFCLLVRESLPTSRFYRQLQSQSTQASMLLKGLPDNKFQRKLLSFVLGQESTLHRPPTSSGSSTTCTWRMVVGVGVLEFRAVKAGPSSISVASQHGSQGTKCPSVFHRLVQSTPTLPLQASIFIFSSDDWGLLSLVKRATKQWWQWLVRTAVAEEWQSK